MRLLAPLYKALGRWLTEERKSPHYPRSDFGKLRHEIRSGDVILVEGRSRVAEVIGTITRSRWTHAALYIGRLHDVQDPRVRQRIRDFYDGQPDVQLIAESQLGMGTVIRPLHVYQHRHLRICRPRDLAYEDMQLVLSYAIGRLGTRYDVRQILDLWRFYLPWSIFPRRFQSSLFRWKPGGSTRTVCSTMLAEAFASVSFPLLPLVKREQGGEVQLFQRNPKLFTPSDFDYSPYFDIIKYPYMDFEGPSSPAYRLMPWEGSMSLTKEEARHYVDQDRQEPESALPSPIEDEARRED